MKKVMGSILLLLIVLIVSAVARTWTSTAGYTVEADLAGLEDRKVYLQTLSEHRIVAVEISKLSKEDRAYLVAYRAGLERERAKEEQQAAEQGKRKAIWHKQIADAEKESLELELPILILFTIPNDCEKCAILEKKILSSGAFKLFADGNLVLFRLDYTLRSELEVWQKKNFRIADKCPVPVLQPPTPWVYLIEVDGEMLGALSGHQGLSAEQYVEKIKTRLIK